MATTTIQEAIQRIQSRYSKGVQSDDTRLSSRHIYSKLLDTRARLINQAANKFQLVPIQCYQSLPAVEMIQVPINDYPAIPPLGYILRSKFPIPNIVANHTRLIMKPVMSIDGQTRFESTDWESMKYIKDNKFTSQVPRFYIHDIGNLTGKYLYITTTRRPEAVVLYAVFEDPIEAHVFPVYCATSNIQNMCPQYPSLEFPIEEDMLGVAVELVAQELIDAFTKQKRDKANNSKDDNTEPSQDQI